MVSRRSSILCILLYCTVSISVDTYWFPCSLHLNACRVTESKARTCAASAVLGSISYLATPFHFSYHYIFFLQYRNTPSAAPKYRRLHVEAYRSYSDEIKLEPSASIVKGCGSFILTSQPPKSSQMCLRKAQW